MIRETPEKSISERLNDALSQLSPDQLRFVALMQEYKSKKDAADALRLNPDTVYHWPKVVDEALKLTELDAVEAARTLRRQSLFKAMMVKRAGLDSDDERIRQGAATEIIEGELGKAEQTVKGDVAGVLVLAIGGIDPAEDI